MVVGASFDHDHVHSIDTDNVDLAVQGVRHLAALGHRRIAYLGGGLEICNNIDRWKGFRQGCAEAGVEFDDRLTLRVPGWRLTTPQQRQQLGALLRGPGRATAIFAAGYYFALDVYGAAAEAGLTIPGDLSVVGVDDPPSAEHLSPPMTTLRQPLEQMGRMAAAGLGQLVQRADSWPRLTRLRAELIVRGSTAKAPAESANRRRD
jgi:DNA-binding LacI/PurR family transcriptional regulator